jgi:beta-carotene ketolase (CrtO type)
MAGYKTPVDNLWHSASGAFPMSFISGWPGRNTANMLLRGPSPLQRARKLARRG